METLLDNVALGKEEAWRCGDGKSSSVLPLFYDSEEVREHLLSELGVLYLWMELKTIERFVLVSDGLDGTALRVGEILETTGELGYLVVVGFPYHDLVGDALEDIILVRDGHVCHHA